jgi:hypothetical protein
MPASSTIRIPSSGPIDVLARFAPFVSPPARRRNLAPLS